VGIVLPGFIVGGIALFRRKALGYLLAPMMLGLGIVMDLALVGMTLSMTARGFPGAMKRLPVFVAAGVLTFAALVALLRRLRPVPPVR
jgi:hypothetical protein